MRSLRSLSAITVFVAGTTLSGTASAAEKITCNPDVIDCNKTFNMQIQRFPIDDPTNPTHMTRQIDCGLVFANAAGQARPSYEFIGQVDPNKDYPPRNVSALGLDPNYSAGIGHVGGMSPRDHQLDRAWAEIYSGEFKRRKSGYPVESKGQILGYTAVPISDFRYSPIWAAVAHCTWSKKDDDRVPDIYDIAPNGDLILNAEKLKILENPPRP